MDKNIQTLAAINLVSLQNATSSPTKPVEYDRFLVLSLGTGTAKVEQKYDAEQAAKWGLLGWLVNGGSSPLADIFLQASGDLVDFHLSTIFQLLNSHENYLRIQVPNQPFAFLGLLK